MQQPLAPILEKGKLKIEHKYSWVSNFKDGKAQVIIDSKEMYINKRGKKIKISIFFPLFFTNYQSPITNQLNNPTKNTP